MTSLRIEEKIGAAWGYHRKRQHEKAVEEFKSILAAKPDSVDANYGLGMAERACGRTNEAIAAFQKSLAIAEEALNAVRTTASAEGMAANNNLETYVDDRFMMLIRMIKQRLNELGVKG